MFVRRESFKEYITYYPITSGLIALNVLMFLLMELYGSSESTYTLLKFGAMFGIEGFRPEWWRFFTAIVLHGGLTHLIFNCFALLVFAPPLERLLGKWRYILYYATCGVIGNVFSYWLQFDDYISVGASGAIFGVYAAYIYLVIFHKQLLDFGTRKTIQTIVIVGFVYSFVPGIDLWAHLGGFVGGFALMSLMVMMIRRRRT